MEQTDKSIGELNINNPNFWENYREWQKNLKNKGLDDADHREREQELEDYVLDSWGF